MDVLLLTRSLADALAVPAVTAELGLADGATLADWFEQMAVQLGSRVVWTTVACPAGERFARMYGGIGALLRYTFAADDAEPDPLEAHPKARAPVAMAEAMAIVGPGGARGGMDEVPDAEPAVQVPCNIGRPPSVPSTCEMPTVHTPFPQDPPRDLAATRSIHEGETEPVLESWEDLLQAIDLLEVGASLPPLPSAPVRTCAALQGMDSAVTEPSPVVPPSLGANPSPPSLGVGAMAPVFSLDPTAPAFVPRFARWYR